MTSPNLQASLTPSALGDTSFALLLAELVCMPNHKQRTLDALLGDWPW